MSHLVDEALAKETVLAMVDAAPEADRHWRIAHDVADLEVRDAINEVVRVERAHHLEVLAVLQTLRLELH